MSNISDLGAFKQGKQQESRREFLDRFLVLLKGVPGEVPGWAAALRALESAYALYLDNIPVGSWWEYACTPGFAGEMEEDGTPINALIRFAAGRSGIEPIMANIERMFGMASLVIEHNLEPARFAKLAILDPVMVYDQWLEERLGVHGDVIALQEVLFKFLMDGLREQGLKIDTLRKEGDVLEMTLMDRTCVMRLHLDFQHFKLTSDELKRGFTEEQLREATKAAEPKA